MTDPSAYEHDCPHGHDRRRCETCEAIAERDEAAKLLNDLNDYIIRVSDGRGIDGLVAERDELRDALRLVYFHLGPPQPRLDHEAGVPALVEKAMAERDELRAVVEDAAAVLGGEDNGYDEWAALLGRLRSALDRGTT